MPTDDDDEGGEGPFWLTAPGSGQPGGLTDHHSLLQSHQAEMVTRRLALALAEYLELQSLDRVRMLLDKCQSLDVFARWWSEHNAYLPALRDTMLELLPDRARDVLREVAETEPALARAADDWSSAKARWRDLERCALLAGESISGGMLIPLEPDLPESAAAREDALTADLRGARLPNTASVVKSLEDSAAAFLRDDHTGCLSDARAAMETVTKDIAEVRTGTRPPGFRAAVDVLVTQARLLTKKNDEPGVTGVYAFLSRGPHEAGIRDDEMARLGRGLAISVCYFMVKKHTAQG